MTPAVRLFLRNADWTDAIDEKDLPLLGHIIMSFDNSTFEYDEFDPTPEPEMGEPESVRHIAMGMLGFLSIAGIIGNSLVLYVFTRQRQKLSSTIFILTLAGTDLITSFLTMPYTIALEFLNYNVSYDAVCKVYFLLTTTTIPFSASVMVAIAVDRYLCIVHPFKHTMTIRRAKVSVMVLALFSVCLGIPFCLMYGIYAPYEMNINTVRQQLSEIALASGLTRNDTGVLTSTLPNLTNTPEDSFYTTNTTSDQTSISYGDTATRELRNTGKCHKNGLILGYEFFEVYQKVYSSYYAVCAVIVIVLYTIIYRSVLTRRRRRLHLTMANSCCGFISAQGQQNGEGNDHEQTETECTVLNTTARDKSPSSGQGSRRFREEAFPVESVEMEDKNGNASCTADANSCAAAMDKDVLMRPNGVSRAKLEKLRMANIKTAFCLSIVALTYIVAFLPAWLMALRIIDMNAIVFFLYFTYNVANPIIYAFLNHSFRNHLQTLCKC